MPISLNCCPDYVWVKNTLTAKIYFDDSLAITNPNLAMGNSILINQPVIVTNSNIQDQNWQIATFVLIMICVYCYVLFRFIRAIRQVFKSSVSIASTMATIDNPSRDFNKFLTVTKYLSLFGVSIPLFIATSTSSKLPPEHNLIIIFVIIFLVAAIFTFKILIRKLAGKVTQTQDFFEYLSLVESFNISAAAIVITPLAIALPFYPPLLNTTICIIAAIYIYQLIRIYSFIHGKKFSFMQWFLYLCGVELMPLCVTIAAIVLINTTVLR